MASDPNKDWPHIRLAVVDLVENKIIKEGQRFERLNMLKFFSKLQKSTRSGSQPYYFTESKLFSFIDEWYVQHNLIIYDKATDSYTPLENPK